MLCAVITLVNCACIWSHCAIRAALTIFALPFDAAVDVAEVLSVSMEVVDDGPPVVVVVGLVASDSVVGEALFEPPPAVPSALPAVLD